MKPAEPQPADLEALFRECGPDLSAYFARRHGGTEAARDLVQESFLQFARRLRDGQRPGSPRAYLFGIARRLSLAFRRRHKDPAESLDAVPAPAVSAEPDARLEAARETIAALPALQREILDLRFVHGLSYAEIATVLGVPVGTVRSRLHHAVARLRERLEAEHAGEESRQIPHQIPRRHRHET